MKIVTAESTIGTDREVDCPNGGFKSLRMLLAKDGMGFSVHKTIIPAGEPQHWHYTRHLEACYCIQGKGLLKNLETGFEYFIKPDTMYVLDKHDNHTFQALEDVVLISIFNPPITGKEVHGEDGSYQLVTVENHGSFEKIKTQG